jgi:hypothetical protein
VDDVPRSRLQEADIKRRLVTVIVAVLAILPTVAVTPDGAFGTTTANAARDGCAVGAVGEAVQAASTTTSASAMVLISSPYSASTVPYASSR